MQQQGPYHNEELDLTFNAAELADHDRTMDLEQEMRGIGGGTQEYEANQSKGFLVGLLAVAATGLFIFGVYVLAERGAFSTMWQKLAGLFEREELPGGSKPSVNKPFISQSPRLSSEEVAKNPYWNLPNAIDSSKSPAPNRRWTTVEQERYRLQLSHHFVWQRYKTVAEIRQRRLRDSEEILWYGLNQPKFWLRMRSVMGLADMGLEVGTETVEKAIGYARPELVENFFKRFQARQTAGESYILRQAIKLVNEAARLSILNSLVRHKDQYSDLYLIAATYDPGKRVGSWLNDYLPSRRIPMAKIKEYQNVVFGKGTIAQPQPTVEPESAREDFAEEAEESTPATKGTELKDLAVEFFHDVGGDDEANPAAEKSAEAVKVIDATEESKPQ